MNKNVFAMYFRPWNVAVKELFIGGYLQHLHALADEIGAELPELFKFAIGICDKGAILGGIIGGNSVIVRYFKKAWTLL